MKEHKITVCILLIFFFFTDAAVAQISPTKISFLTAQEIIPILQSANVDIPLELQNLSQKQLETNWLKWITNQDLEIRKRLEQGDEDSIVNLLLFGSSFSSAPRMTEVQMTRLAQEKGQNAVQVYQAVLQNRLEDFTKALVKKQKNERLDFAKKYLIKKLKIDVETENNRNKVKKYLLRSLMRVFNESTSFAKLIQEAKNNEVDEFSVRSKLFNQRGLSSDTSLKPNLAIENAIIQIKEKGYLKNIKKVAIIGPGLDFTDKEEGYDFYPPQTIQPFAVIESLLKVNLVNKNDLRIDTFDLSPKVNTHINNFAGKAKLKENYTIQIPIDTEKKLTEEFSKYWESFGSIIAIPNKSTTLTDLPNVKNRAVSVRSEFLSKIHPFDTNIVLQSPQLQEKDRYDLIIGTNIFLYYDSFGQALAMKNLEKMLKQGGILLSNNSLIEFPFNSIHSIGYTKTTYSDKTNDGDAIVWYQKNIE
jgi:hypothetical protein